MAKKRTDSVEYEVVDLPPTAEGIKELLNSLGEDGWKLVQVERRVAYLIRDL